MELLFNNRDIGEIIVPILVQFQIIFFLLFYFRDSIVINRIIKILLRILYFFHVTANSFTKTKYLVSITNRFLDSQ